MKEKIKSIINVIIKNYKWCVLLICVAIFIAIFEDVYEQEKMIIDTIVYNFAVLFLRRDSITTIMKIITNLGSAYFLITVTILSIIFLKNKKISMLIVANLVISTGLNILLKNIVQRPRPEGYRLIEENGYSFPSGHSMVSVAFYGFIVYLIWKKVENKKLKYFLCGLLSILAVAIGFSRIYLGVHYASDVLAGGVLSIAYLVAYTHFVNIKYNQQRRNKLCQNHPKENT